MEQLRDIISLIDIERRLGLYDALDSTVSKTDEMLVDAIKQCNKTVALYLIEVSLAVEANEIKLSDNGMEIISKCRKEIGRVFPEILEYEKNVTASTQISKLLSDRSKVMLKAAIWQNNAVCSDSDYGFRDAGMFCLSYIRLLELEMNERVLPVLWNNRVAIETAYNNNRTKEKISGEGAGQFDERWKNTKKVLKEDENNPGKPKGLTAGEWGHFFNMFPKNKDYAGTTQIFETLCTFLEENVFNNLGMQALKSGKIATFFDQKGVIEKYRNPPAHTRYITVSIANECKSFVESTILELSTYYKEV